MNRVDLKRWSEVRAHFDDLVDLEPRERAVRLAQIGETDSELRDAIESLIRMDALADDPLQRMEFGAADLLAHTDSANFDVADPLNLTGRTISHFRILDAVATGGMGVVYRANDTRLGRVVAMKFPLPYHALDGAARERFLSEARSAGALDHPNLCSVYEAGASEGGLWFLAMPFYAGATLKSCISARGPLPIQQALDITLQIAEGLAYAHAAGIVHRDLKPGNVMVLPDGRVKILDFGLAKVADLSRTAASNALGTAAYMAPEQIRGESVDGRTDLWALGVVLYEMLVGARPFSGENELSVMHAVTHEPVPRASVLRNDIPPAVEALILNLLQKNPADRYASAQAVARDLAAARRGQKPSFRLGPHRRATLWLRERRRRLAAAMIVLGIVAIATVGLAAEQLLPSLARKPTKNAEAYELFRRAQEYETRVWAMHEWNPEWHKAAETLYRRALALDPKFALARARLADVLATQQFDPRQRSPAGLEAVRREAEAALKLQPKLAAARLVMSFYWEMRGDFERALAEAKRARDAAPSDAEAHANLGSLYFKLGRWDDALAAYRRGARLDPKRGVHLARLYVQLRRYEQAARTYDQYLLLVPDDYGSMLFKGHAFLLWHGSADSLSAVLERVPNGWDPDGFATRMRVMVARRERQPEDALGALANSRSQFLGRSNPLSLMRGIVYSEAGDSARAVAEFESARDVLADSVTAHPDDAEWRIALAQAWAGVGEGSRGVREIEKALALIPRVPKVENDAKLLAGAAAALAMAREHDRAIEILERLLKHPTAGLYTSVPLLRVDPTWDALRYEARFQLLIAD